ncbi:phage holin [Sutcliffiella horikoshii]|uniref:Phage holin n=1 Tax=Sutcliffiella horikoshii TaxID=79883 RepID=A0A1Y0CMA5_9BACI|nr:phage holin [Sutcliffiella horikoshii]ART76433.1 phage holin [Sutcliffiella horikoshii]TYS53643.1 phage holin [Sutcliffiella horikoshii]
MSEQKQIRPISKGAWFRIVFLAFALVNQLLVVYGKSPLPFTEAQLEQLFSLVWTAVAALVAWWKDNDWSEKARSRIK